MKRPWILAFLFTLIPVGSLAAEDSELHDWTSAGGHKVGASLLRSETTYVLRKQNGAEIRVPAGVLSEESRGLAEAILSQRASANSGLQVLVGEVVSIADGDSLTVLDDAKTQHRVRLEGIDCPEGGQDYSRKASMVIADKVLRKRVRVQWMSLDPYDRILADVYVGDRWINREMVEEGLAWHYKKYSQSRALAEAETKARAAKLGLWQDKSAIPPWEFRRKSSRPVAPKVAQKPKPAERPSVRPVPPP